MNNEKENNLAVIIIIIVIILLVIGGYYLFKWCGPSVKELKSQCPDMTKLTDYSSSHTQDGSYNQFYYIECDGEIMDYTVTVDYDWDCQRWDKWGKCKYQETVYSSKKNYPNRGGIS